MSRTYGVEPVHVRQDGVVVVDAPELDVPDAVVEAGPPRVQRHHLDVLAGERVVLQLIPQVERLRLVVIFQTTAGGGGRLETTRKTDLGSRPI